MGSVEIYRFCHRWLEVVTFSLSEQWTVWLTLYQYNDTVLSKKMIEIHPVTMWLIIHAILVRLMLSPKHRLTRSNGLKLDNAVDLCMDFEMDELCSIKGMSALVQ